MKKLRKQMRASARINFIAVIDRIRKLLDEAYASVCKQAINKNIAASARLEILRCA